MISRNIKIFKIDNFFGGFYPLVALMVVYFESITGSYATAMLMYAITNIATTIMEVPTGIFSDKLGRKRTVILSNFLFFISTVLWALAGSLESVFILGMGSFIFGISDAFLSGTDEAFMYETVEEMGQKDKFDELYAKNGFWLQTGLACACFLGAIITYFYDMVTLAWLSTIVTAILTCIGFFYVEPKSTKEAEKTTSLKHFKKSFKDLWKNKRLRFYALISMTDNAVGMSTHRFEGAYSATLVPIWAVNLVRFIKQASGAVSYYIVPKVKKYGSVRVLFTSMSANVIIRFIGVMLNNMYSPFIIATVNLFYGTVMTSTADILQKEFTANQRATMKSIISFFGGIFGAIILYIFGVLADLTSPMIVILLAISIKALIVILSLNVLRAKKKKGIFY